MKIKNKENEIQQSEQLDNVTPFIKEPVNVDNKINIVIERIT